MLVHLTVTPSIALEIKQGKGVNIYVYSKNTNKLLAVEHFKLVSRLKEHTVVRAFF